MNDHKPTVATSTKPESLTSKGKPGRFWQVFWLTCLVVSLAYAWYSFYAPSNRIAWVNNFTMAQQQAVESDKPMILFFTGKWCSPCQIMKRQVWADDQVMSTVNAAFVPVTIDVDDSNAAAALSSYRVGATPTTIITDSKGNVLQWRQGGMSKAEFLDLLGELDSSIVEDL
ncbi:MAG: thiol:disulfide interchange protein [Planctomycetota bacterium]|nr:MAG: thiol:disulfide interchange protein [Planctomycetota bacterium]